MTRGKSTYKKLSRWHKLRYNFYRSLNKLGFHGFPSEYWEPTGPEGARGMRDAGYKLTEKGWVKRSSNL